MTHDVLSTELLYKSFPRTAQRHGGTSQPLIYHKSQRNLTQESPQDFKLSLSPKQKSGGFNECFLEIAATSLGGKSFAVERVR